MGHISLRKFPGTPNWQRVARYIAEGADAPDVAAATRATGNREPSGGPVRAGRPD